MNATSSGSHHLATLSATDVRSSAAVSSAPYYADVVAFYPQAISDHATFEKPHQYATGMEREALNQPGASPALLIQRGAVTR